jgi:hypothetical protein
MSIPTIEATTAMRRVPYICVGFLPLDRLPAVPAGALRLTTRRKIGTAPAR